MHHRKSLHVVYGAGPLGRSVAAEAGRAGHQVVLATRSGARPGPTGARVVKSDATDPASVRRTCAGAAVIYNCAQPPYHRWPELFPPIQRGLVEGAGASGARLVAAENLYMYGAVDGPLHEGLPYAPTSRKGEVRARMATELQQANVEGVAQTTSGRASDFFGAGVDASFMGASVFKRAARGRRTYVLGDPDHLHTYTYIGDFARALVTLAGSDAALGRAWHVPSAPTLTTRQFVQLIGAQNNRTPRVHRLPSAAVRVGGVFNPLAREAYEMLYEFDRPFVVDHTRFAKTFGDSCTPHETAIRATLASLSQEATGA